MGVSIRHQPEYLPSHTHRQLPRDQDGSVKSFQSGISLSICLHDSISSGLWWDSHFCFNQASA